MNFISVVNQPQNLFEKKKKNQNRMSGQNLIPETSYQNLAEDSMERNVIDTLTEFYTNFAKYA